MPTATATLSWTITNWGPLTTSWSLPSACSSRVYIFPTASPSFGNYADCDNGLFTCYPSPTDSDAPSALSEARNTPTLGFQAAPVYSPAPSCPSGWKTVGAVGREGQGASVSRSGWFTLPYDEDVDEEGINIPEVGFQDVLASLLDPSETAVMCCPSSMTVGENGGCQSSLSDYTISTACRTHYSPNSIDDVLTSIGAGQISWTTDKTTFPASDIPSLTAQAVVDPLVLLHKPTDLAGGDNDDDDEQEENDHVEGEGEDPSETNAAAALRAGDGFFGIGGRVVASAFASILAGAAMVLLR
ncbi:hypothetical protein BJY01DRAFT_259710 [Aspergillus pseudoustus]|uniref:Uncharacterized protein n=1 Tax=Aspergillus pseudoustus TaxID=1810923 RepID=A0ABR4J2I0_9EURO